MAPTVLEELGATVIPIGVEPDGENINANCGALHPELASRIVLENGADVGMALDGDGDRIVGRDPPAFAEAASRRQAITPCT